jgi:hypothetical protein
MSFANLFRLMLEFVILAKGTNVGLCSIRQTRPIELAQSNNTVGDELMQLYLNRFQYMAKETDNREAKAAKEKNP